MKAALASLVIAVAAALAGCAGPYDHALYSSDLERPEPVPNPADQRALAPYAAAPYFRSYD